MSVAAGEVAEGGIIAFAEIAQLAGLIIVGRCTAWLALCGLHLFDLRMERHRWSEVYVFQPIVWLIKIVFQTTSSWGC